MGKIKNTISKLISSIVIRFDLKTQIGKKQRTP